MSRHDQIILTPKGLALLEGMLEQLGSRHGLLGAMLARKLDLARVVPASELEPGVATLNSRVRFHAGLGPFEERTLVWGDGREAQGATLPVSVPRGLALIGMSAGQAAVVPMPDGRVESLVLDTVLFQPESAWRSGAAEEADPGPNQGAPSGLVTSLSDFRARRDRRWGPADGGDDPGPSAA